MNHKVVDRLHYRTERPMLFLWDRVSRDNDLDFSARNSAQGKTELEECILIAEDPELVLDVDDGRVEGENLLERQVQIAFLFPCDDVRDAAHSRLAARAA
jgi:hypothetical protein